jgi:hypothetical protein
LLIQNVYVEEIACTICNNVFLQNSEDNQLRISMHTKEKLSRNCTIWREEQDNLFDVTEYIVAETML